MNVLVIGGAGYIGSHVAREFLDQGHQVTVFDNLSTGIRENLFDEGEFIEGDIRDADQIAAAMKGGFDGVIHLAACKAVGESMTNPGKFAVNNISGTINILNAMLEAGVANIVFSSSASVFGEPKYIPLDEKHDTNPESFYGFTKLDIERLMEWYEQLKGLKYSSLRYFNACGYDVQGRITGLEHDTSNLIPVLMEVAVGKREKVRVFGTDYDTRDGTCIRDYIHVNDLATAHVRSLEAMVATGRSRIYNLGTETGSTVLEILDLTRKVTGHPVPAAMADRRPGDPSNLVASPKLIHEELGWEAKHSDLQTIIESTWRAYQANYPDA